MKSARWIIPIASSLLAITFSFTIVALSDAPRSATGPLLAAFIFIQIIAVNWMLDRHDEDKHNHKTSATTRYIITEGIGTRYEEAIGYCSSFADAKATMERLYSPERIADLRVGIAIERDGHPHILRGNHIGRVSEGESAGTAPSSQDDAPLDSFYQQDATLPTKVRPRSIKTLHQISLLSRTNE
ncbi:MAG: hypothetical protein HQL38_10805 [Alphaproteobacteria bacterium]|nr:hypothetical protein [Alphaproteobacteria bacterium]